MVAAILALITALVSYFASKKAGASDGQAALAGLAAGGAAYYVGTQTEWGKNAVASIEDWIGLKGDGDTPLLNDDGSPAKAPPGAQPVLDGNGQPMKDPSGNIIWKLVDSAGNVLTSWGPVGTAGVIGAGAVASGSENSWLLIGGAVLAAVLILK